MNIVNMSVEMKKPNTPMLSSTNQRKYSLVSGFSCQGGEGAREDDDRREEDHHHGDAVHADAIGDLERFEPRDAIGEQHVGGIATGALVDEIDSQPDGQRQQGGSTDNHHATHLIEVLGQPRPKSIRRGITTNNVNILIFLLFHFSYQCYNSKRRANNRATAPEMNQVA